MTCTSATLAPAEDDFEGGNIDRPYISGSHYNGKAKPEFFDPKNMIKGFKFRFGQLLKFVEKTGIWLSDPSGNELHLDEESKNMTLTTKGTLTLNCSNLIFNVDQNMTTNILINKNEIIGANYSESIVGQKIIGIGGDLQTVVDGKYFEHIKGNFESKTENDRQEIGNAGITIESDNDVDKHSKNNINYNSGEETRQN